MEPTNIFREITPLSNHDCFLIIDRTKNKFSYPVHVHPEIELNFIENAKGAKRIMGDSIEEIDDLELCLIGSEKLEHGWVDFESESEISPIHEITIQFHSDLFIGSLLTKKQFHSLAVMFENAKKGLVFSQPAIGLVKEKLKTLANNKNDFFSVLDLLYILYELSIDNDARILCNSTFVDEIEVSESKRVQKLINYIEANYKNVLRLGEIATKFGFSEVSFSRFIKKRTGKNFVEYVNDLRLGMASSKLVNSNSSIAEICYECGFNNLSNFNRIFKNRKGCSPKEFRDNYTKIRKFI
jgi:AraC-like DNA-binding protein